MKKLALCIAASLLAFGLQAQTGKGKINISGSLGYSQSKGTSNLVLNGVSYESAGYNYTLAPAVGYFLKDNLEVGISASYTKGKSEDVSPSENSVLSSDYRHRSDHLSAYARQYKYLTPKLAVHAALVAGIGTERTEVNSLNSSPNFQSYQSHYQNKASTIALSPGITFFASERIGISASLGALQYEHKKRSYSSWFRYQGRPDYTPTWEHGAYRSSSIKFDFSSVNLNFGLSYFLGR